MRTSRVAKETAQLVKALSPKGRSTRRTPKEQIVQTSSTDEYKVEEANSDDESEHHTQEHNFANPGLERPRKKRKLSADEIPATPTKLVERIATATSAVSHTSPLKTPLKRAVDSSPQNFAKRARRQPAKPIKDVSSGEVIAVEPPAKWEDMYRLTEEMRALWPAPVDTMGCESLAEDKRTPRDRRYQTLIALMLSSQTKDTVTAVAMKNLQQNLKGGFTLESILAVEPSRLNELISKVGFHNNKTKYIKAAAEIIRDKWKSDIPDTIEGLCSLPGVGPKMAYLCMSAAWGRDEGIGVDVHVHRITNLWGWHKTSTPEATRAQLESWLPRDKWHDINHLLVGFGQTWCPPVGRKCGECKLAETGLCPSAVVDRTVKKKVKKEEVVVKTETGEEKASLTNTEIKIEVQEQTLEALEASAKPQIQDIEDIGVRRRSARIKK